ncbi:DNA repair protein RecO [bacterium MnTg04]|nr:DNA repair protein RecO [bacterium MnTg04]
MSIGRRGQLHAAFVLHQRPYRDSSRIADLLTAEFGRVTVVARGIRSRRGGQGALLQPFRPLLVSWSGRSEMKTLNTVEASGEPFALTGSVLFSGFYLNELLLRLTHKNDPHPELFAVYHATLERLDQSENQPRALRIFEKRLLECLGYGLNLAQTAGDGQPVDASRHYTYQVERGPQLSVAENSASYAGRSLLSLAGEDLTDARSLQDARRLLRHTLDFYLGDKPLKSRQILYSMRSW